MTPKKSLKKNIVIYAGSEEEKKALQEIVNMKAKYEAEIQKLTTLLKKALTEKDKQIDEDLKVVKGIMEFHDIPSHVYFEIENEFLNKLKKRG